MIKNQKLNYLQHRPLGYRPLFHRRHLRHDDVDLAIRLGLGASSARV